MAPVAGARPAERRKRPKGERRHRARYILVSILAVLILVAVLFRSFWTDVWNSALDHLKQSKPVPVASIVATSSAVGHPAAKLTDGQPSVFWAPNPARPAKGQRIRATFASPIRLVYLGVYNGASTTTAQFLQQSNVSKIDVALLRKSGDPIRHTYTLKPNPGEQRFDIGESDITGVVIVIRGVNRPANAGRLAAIGELEFFAR